MAQAYKQYTMTATAASLTTIMGVLLPDKHVMVVDVFAKSTNTGHIFMGKSDVTNVPANAGVDLVAGSGYSFQPANPGHVVDTDNIYLVGTAADIAFISVVY
jgi:hypothetical protein